ncbi:hypothetical protein Tco_1282146 [Tanacetum coccineum]
MVVPREGATPICEGSCRLTSLRTARGSGMIGRSMKGEGWIRMDNVDCGSAVLLGRKESGSIGMWAIDLILRKMR